MCSSHYRVAKDRLPQTRDLADTLSSPREEILSLKGQRSEPQDGPPGVPQSGRPPS